jgi:hypothetical protein
MGLSSMQRRAAKIFLAIGLILGCGPATAAETAVDLELVLAVDVSRSMDMQELALQRDGYVAAFRHPQVIEAITTGGYGRIAVAFVEWAGPGYQTVVAPWTVISSAAEAGALADRLDKAPIVRETGTSISGSLFFAARQFDHSPVRGVRRVIDVSGDGPNNMGLPVAPSRDEVLSDGITINGLPIMLKPVSTFGGFNIPHLDIYYEDCVIGGPGAFVVTVKDVHDFESAIRRKLVLEIANKRAPAQIIPAALETREPRIDCLIGEKTRGRWFDLRDTPGQR